MSYSYQFVIEYKDHEKVTCVHRESARRDLVYFNRIQLPDGRFASYNDISPNDILTVTYVNNQASSIILSKPVAPTALISQLKAIQSLSTLNSNSLNSFFSTFREVKTSGLSLNLSFFISLIDLSIIYRYQDSLTALQELHTKLHYYISQDIKQVRSLLIFQEISQILRSMDENSKKLEKVTNVYETNKSEIEKLVNHSVKLAALTRFHKESKGRVGRDLNSINHAATTGAFELSDFVYLLNLLKVELRIIEAKNLRITNWGDYNDLVLTLVKTEDSAFIPIYSKQASFLGRCSASEYQDAVSFFNSLNAGKKEEDYLKSQVKDQKEVYSKLAQSVQQLFKHPEMSNYTVDDIDPGLIDENSELICSLCKILTKIAEYPCGHSFCQDCSQLYNGSFLICQICQFCALPSEITPQYS